MFRTIGKNSILLSRQLSSSPISSSPFQGFKRVENAARINAFARTAKEKMEIPGERGVRYPKYTRAQLTILFPLFAFFFPPGQRLCDGIKLFLTNAAARPPVNYTRQESTRLLPSYDLISYHRKVCKCEIIRENRNGKRDRKTSQTSDRLNFIFVNENALR